VLVGKTTTAIGTQGIRLEGSNGKIEATRSGNVVTTFNRTGSDGTISEYMKDGSSVGSIGTISSGGSQLAISNANTGLCFRDNQSAILPSSSTTLRDNALDLGNSSFRFKDFYISGGVYLGGTGASNKLDDYEGGYWTPTLNGVSGSVFKNSYIKVGNQVTVTAFFSSISWNTGANTVDGLPFTNGYGHASVYSPSNSVVIQQATVDGTQIKFRAATSGSSTYLLVAATYIQD